MPLYSFHCASCGKDFEAFLRMRDVPAGASCPGCGGVTVDQCGPGVTTQPAACGLSKKS
jgi:putative FmdB family regulatory protein